MGSEQQGVLGGACKAASTRGAEPAAAETLGSSFPHMSQVFRTEGSWHSCRKAFLLCAAELNPGVFLSYQISIFSQMVFNTNLLSIASKLMGTFFLSNFNVSHPLPRYMIASGWSLCEKIFWRHSFSFFVGLQSFQQLSRAVLLLWEFTKGKSNSDSVV